MTTRGAMILKSGRCGSVDNEKHFKMHEKFIRYYSQILRQSEDTFSVGGEI